MALPTEILNGSSVLIPRIGSARKRSFSVPAYGMKLGFACDLSVNVPEANPTPWEND